MWRTSYIPLPRACERITHYASKCTDFGAAAQQQHASSELGRQDGGSHQARRYSLGGWLLVQEENDDLCNRLVEGGTFTKLNQELWPGCFYARSDSGDVARVEDRTFICSLSKDGAGPTNNWVNPYEMRKKLKELFSGCMHGRTMYVLPFSMVVPSAALCRRSACS